MMRREFVQREFLISELKQYEKWILGYYVMISMCIIFKYTAKKKIAPLIQKMERDIAGNASIILKVFEQK